MWLSVQIYFLQGKQEQALVLLRKSVDEGWGSRYLNDLTQFRSWQFREPGVLERPGFQVLIEDMRAAMARQLALVRDLEREAPPSP